MRAALYARFSTDMQRPTSTEDQLRLCREHAAREGLEVVEEYFDEGISGTVPLARRPGGARLIADAKRGAFEVLVVEALDRFSRDGVDQEQMVRLLEFEGLQLVGLADGYSTRQEGRELMRWMRGGINEEFVRATAKKVHRGLEGQIKRGFHAGGISYGYRSVVAGVDAHGEPIGHRLEVDDEQAGWVRWIFARAADGWSCRAIAAELNKRGIPTRDGSTWSVAALYGSPNKGSGVLNNVIYIGQYVWNRSKWVKHPVTRKRTRKERPREEWMIEERPELRIVDDITWRAVRNRIDTSREAGGMKGRGAKMRGPFSGLLRCAKCGGAVIIVSATAYGCAARKDRGPAVCTGLYARRDALNSRLLSTVRDELLTNARVAEFRKIVAALAAARRRAQHDAGADRAKRLEALERQIRNLVAAIKDMGISPTLKAELQAAEKERAALVAAGPASPRPEPEEAVGSAVARLKAKLMQLREAVEAGGDRGREALRTIFGEEIRLLEEPDGIYAEFSAPAQRLLVAAGAVAGNGCGDAILLSATKRIRVT